jgi:hypothetical protein
MAAAVAHPISPELVLVSPDLRAEALASLAEPDPDALFRVPPRAQPRLVLVPPPEPRPALPVAVAAYFAEALFLGAVRGAAMVAAIAVAAFVLAR